MAKHNKREENKELNSILEKLKKSYDSESQKELDDLRSDSKSEEDMELSMILGKIFSENKAQENTESEEIDVVEAEELQNDTAQDVSEDLKAEELSDNSVTNENETEPENEKTEIEESEDEAADGKELGSIEKATEMLSRLIDENSETEVENVFQLMFPEKEAESQETIEDDSDLEYEEFDEIQNNIESDEGACEDEFAVEDEEYEISADSIPDAQEDKNIVLDPKDYVYDSLQEQLPVFSAKSNISAIDSTTHDKSTEETKDFGLDNTDISLLLKLGYGEEVKTQIGEDKAQKAIFEADKEFTPESQKIIYGYCDNEFSDRSQIRKIKTKYKSDRNGIILNLVFVAIISIVIFMLDLFFEFFSDRSSYLLLMLFELLLVAIITVILRKRICSGLVGIARFEGNLYSVLSFLLFSYYLYCIVTAVLYLINHNSINNSNLMLFGFTVSVYSILIIVADLTNCIRETKVFNIMASSQEIYTAEENSNEGLSGNGTSSESQYSSKGEKSFSVRKTSIVSGYFRKTSKSGAESVNLIYVIGIVPIVSLIIGCLCAIFNQSIMRGITSMMITSLMCVPFFYVCVPAFTEYIVSSEINRKKTAFIGTSPIEEYAKTESVFFSDVDAVEVISCTEIHPTKSVNSKQLLAQAHSIFASLGGPLALATEQYKNPDEVSENIIKDVVINSISENGIDIYFDSSINILIGDKQYMQAHNIKVKTDSNLATATKGFDRAVIYMSFDGVPKLGFIVTSKIKADFSETVARLDKEGIKVFVNSYEPQINDMYFEQNKNDFMPSVSVCKSTEFRSQSVSSVCDGSVISATDSLPIADLVLVSKKILEKRKLNRRILFATVIVGVLISCLLTLLLSVDGAIYILSGLKTHITFLFNLLMIVALIPGVVSILKLKKQFSDMVDKL